LLRLHQLETAQSKRFFIGCRFAVQGKPNKPPGRKRADTRTPFYLLFQEKAPFPQLTKAAKTPNANYRHYIGQLLRLL